MTVQQVIWIAIIGFIMVTGYPVSTPDKSSEERGVNYEDYIRQLERNHNLTYNDIDQPWQTLSEESHEIVFDLNRDDFTSARPLVNNEEPTSQGPVVPVTEKQEVKDGEVADPVTEAQDKQVTDAVAADDSVVPVTEAQTKLLADTQDVAEKTTDTIVADDVTEADESSIPVTDVSLIAKDDTVVPVTETQEKSVSDTLTQDADIPVTETQEKTEANLDEGSGQNDSENSTTYTEDVVVIFINHDGVEDTTDSTVTESGKVDEVEELIVKVDEPLATQSNESVNEGSGLALADSNDEGSGLADVIINILSDGLVGEGSELSTTESDTLFRESATTILPESSHDETSTELSMLITKGLATEEATTESISETAAVIHTKDLDEKEVKSTESPIESTEVKTEIRPSSTEETAQSDHSIPSVIAEAASKLQPDLASSESTEPEAETTTVANVKFVAMIDGVSVDEI